MDAASDNRYDTRFDFDFASSVLLEVAQERSVGQLLQKCVGAALTHPEFARVEFWLVEKGGICSRCPQRPQCPDQTRCLHLVAGGENSDARGTRESSCFYNSLERIPLGVGFIGRIAKTGQMMVLDNAAPARDELFGLDLSRLGKVRHCAGAAISFRGEFWECSPFFPM